MYSYLLITAYTALYKIGFYYINCETNVVNLNKSNRESLLL